MKKYSVLALLCVSFVALSTELNKPYLGDSAIRRVENCTCYKSIEAQGLKPWQLDWSDSISLRKQFTHCECKATIDVSNVENPKRYLVPGTVIK
jgi:hypothetical protein